MTYPCKDCRGDQAYKCSRFKQCSRWMRWFVREWRGIREAAYKKKHPDPKPREKMRIL